MQSKSAGEAISGLLFSLSLTAIIIVYTMFYFTSFDVLQTVVADVAQQQQPPQGFEESQFPELKNALVTQCQGSTTGIIDIPLENNQVAKLNCTEVQNINESKQVFGLMVKDAFKNIYYKDYGCSFIDCLTKEGSSTENVTVLISETGHKFFGVIQIYVIAATVLFGMMFAYFSGRPSKIARNFGWVFTFLGSSFIITELMKLRNQTADSTMSIMLKVMDNIFAQFQLYMIAIFVTGIILLVVGYTWAHYETR